MPRTQRTARCEPEGIHRIPNRGRGVTAPTGGTKAVTALAELGQLAVAIKLGVGSGGGAQAASCSMVSSRATLAAPHSA
jgi:hypothetical protein